MDINITQKIFPTTENQNLLKYDAEGLWSITLPTDAEYISEHIKNITGNNITIFDGTGGIGGNIISFSKHFRNIIACEVDNERFSILKNNILTYNLNNVKLINDNCLKYIDKTYEAYFFDPPWSKDYKLYYKISLKLGNMTLVDVINKIRKNNNAPIFFKLPYNYNLEEFNIFNYQLNKVKNYFLVTIF